MVISASAKVYAEIEIPLIPVLADMELAELGDVDALASLSEELGEDRSPLEAAHAEAGRAFNLNSPKLAVILFERGPPVIKKTKTGPSTAAAVLERPQDGDRLCEIVLSTGTCKG